MNDSLDAVLNLAPVLPVIVIQRVEDAVPLARALVKGGIRAMEVTLRTPEALESIERICAEVPEAVVGAGTVLSATDVLRAEAAGARFLVSPGFTRTLVDAALDQGIPLMPGVATPAEAMQLLEHGLTRLKFFPAEAAGGPAMLKAIAGPLPQLGFCPTGGITPVNASRYLGLSNVLCVGGSWLAPADRIAARDWAAITAQAELALSLSGS